VFRFGYSNTFPIDVEDILDRSVQRTPFGRGKSDKAMNECKVPGVPQC
jgi:hypothetical protein